ncbi:MAG: DbpA RNA binding domain-containing protein, partial [Candidatus Cryptobacteroides sp.]
KDRVRKTSRQAPESFSKLFLNLGKMDGLNPQKLLMMVNRTVPDDVEIGRIDLFSRHSVFEVQSDMSRSVIDGLMTLKRNGRQIKVDYATEEQVTRQLERKKQRKDARSAARKDRRDAGK